MHVRKKPKSRFYFAQFTVKGRFYCRSTGATDKALALQIAIRLREEILAGRYGIIMGKGLPLDELLPRYLEWLQRERSPQTLTRAERAIQNVLTRIKARYVDEITRANLSRYGQQRRKEVSLLTVALELRHLRAFLRRCIREGWLADIPCQIEMPKLPSRRRVAFLSRVEVGPFLGELPTWARWAAYLMLNTGLRAEECRFAEWGDVDFVGKLLWVRVKADFSPKNAKERAIPLTPEIATELDIRRQDRGFVCEGPGGGQFNRWAFIEKVRNAGKRAGLPIRITPHTLRRSFGSILAMSGVDLPTIQKLMGHTSILTTMVYLELTDEHRREGIGRLRLPGLTPVGDKVIPIPTEGKGA
jgi:integrase